VQERIRKQEFDARKKLIDALKAEEALKKLKDKYDLERINLTAALNAATDEETKVRLAEKLAILDGNAAMAQKYLLQNAENAAIETVTDSLIILAGAAMDSALKFKQINPFAGTMYGETGRDMASVASIPSLSNVPNGLPPAITNPLAGTYYGETGRDLPSNLRITVDTASTGDKFAQLIAESLQVASRSGYSSVPNGFIA
jgi:hypothetical protein